MDYKKKFLNKKLGVLAVSMIVAGGILIPAHFAGASILDLTGGALNFLLSWLVNLIGWIFGVTLLPFAGYLVNQVFGAGEFINNGLVTSGWEISRDIANMFFILIFVAIGFATTLRIESYNIKRLLPKLIIIALLINFSLVIAGVFIDIGDSIGYFFTHGGITLEDGNDVKIGTNILAAMQLSKTFDIPDDSGFGGDWAAMFTRRLMSMILVIVATFILFAMAFIMLFRMIHLWILLILSPLAWAAYILPGTSSWWSKWWGDFLKWAFFPAIYGFFIYLALLSTLGFNETQIFSGFPEQLDAGGAGSTIPFSNLRFFLQYLTVIFILVTGLILANKWSLAGASTMMKLGTGMKNKAGKMAGGWAKRTGVKLGSNILQPIKTGRGIKDSFAGAGGGGAGGVVKGALGLAGSAFGAKAVGGAALGAYSSVIQARKDQVEKDEKKYAKEDPGLLKLKMMTMDSDQKLAASNSIAANGKIDSLSDDQIASSMSHGVRMGMEKKLVIAAPHIASKNNIKTDSEIEKIIKGMKPKEMTTMSADALKDSDIALTITNNFKEGGGNSGTAAHLNALANNNPVTYSAVRVAITGGSTLGKKALQGMGYKEGVAKVLADGPASALEEEEDKDKDKDKE